MRGSAAGFRLRASSDTLAIGIVFLAIGALAFIAPVQSDTWWLLRAGKDIWQNGVIPLVDSYSHTASGLYWPNHEWLTESLFYAAYAGGGLALVTAMCGAAIVGAWYLSWRLTSGEFETRFLLFAAAFVAAAASWAVRPQAFTMLLFAIGCALLVSRRYAWLPALFLVWANLHGAVALGLVAVAAAGLARLIDERRVPWSLVAAGLASALATCITPLGVGLWTFILESMARSRVNALIEWQAPDFSAGHWPFWLLAIALPALAIRRRQRLHGRTLTLVLISLAVLPLALTARRNVANFVLVGVPALTALLAVTEGTMKRRLAGEREGLNAGLLLGAGVGVCAILAMLWSIPAPRLGWQPISPAATTAIARCDGPLYNTYEDGGVLIWFVPEKPVFIDNRQDPYPIDLLKASHALEFDGAFQVLFDQHRISCAALRSHSIVAARLADAANWTEQYRDEQWVVFARSRP